MSVSVPGALTDRIYEELRGTYPNEGGGFLLGRTANGEVTVVDITPVTNVFDPEEQHHRYAMTPADWMRIEDEADERGLSLVGYFHSHPDSPAVPSEYDRVHALPNFVYIIVGVYDAQERETRVWRLAEDRANFAELSLEIT